MRTTTLKQSSKSKPYTTNQTQSGVSARYTCIFKLSGTERRAQPTKNNQASAWQYSISAASSPTENSQGTAARTRNIRSYPWGWGRWGCQPWHPTLGREGSWATQDPGPYMLFFCFDALTRKLLHPREKNRRQQIPLPGMLTHSRPNINSQHGKTILGATQNPNGYNKDSVHLTSNDCSV